jgi:hypothetical protein
MAQTKTKKRAEARLTEPHRKMLEWDRDPERVRASMSPKLKTLVGKIEERYVGLEKKTLLGYWQIGELVKDAYDNEADYGDHRCGGDLVKRIATALPMCRAFIYETLRFARAYKRDQVEELAARRTSASKPVTWSHMRVLFRLDDQAQRVKLLEQLIEKDWNVVELNEQVNELLRQDMQSGKPQRSAKPKNLDRAVAQQRDLVNRLLTLDEKVWSEPDGSLLHHVSELPPDRCRPEHAEVLKDLADKWRRVGEEAEKRAEDADQAYEHARRYLHTRGQKAGSHATADAATNGRMPKPGASKAKPFVYEPDAEADEGDRGYGSEVEAESVLVA